MLAATKPIKPGRREQRGFAAAPGCPYSQDPRRGGAQKPPLSTKRDLGQPPAPISRGDPVPGGALHASEASAGQFSS